MWGNECKVVNGHTITFVPAGASSVTLLGAVKVVRMMTTRSEDLAKLCSNAASYATPHPNLPPFEPFFCNAADTRLLEDTRSFVERHRPDLLPKLRQLEGRGSLISTAKAERMFGWKPEHSWTEYVPAGAAR